MGDARVFLSGRAMGGKSPGMGGIHQGHLSLWEDKWGAAWGARPRYGAAPPLEPPMLLQPLSLPLGPTPTTAKTHYTAEIQHFRVFFLSG